MTPLMGHRLVNGCRLKHPNDIFLEDPELCAYEGHLRQRRHRFLRTLECMNRDEGGLVQFAGGFQKFGLHIYDRYTVYREWAPAALDAQMIGDFNNWNGTQMQRDTHGVWSCTLPSTCELHCELLDGYVIDIDGRPAVPHMSKFKIRLKQREGRWVDVLSAWTIYAIQNKHRMDGAFDAICWNPPEPYIWKHAHPPKPQSLCIYEAHVGMSSEEPKVATYRYFADCVLPHIVRQSYNAVQLMAIQEHPYYGSIGYHVTNLFAVSSRCGTPEDLKYLIDCAHGMGLIVVLDVVHSHISTNLVDGLAGFDMGQPEEQNYFKNGEQGYHRLWDSKLLNYCHWEVLRLLLSNLRWWMEEYQFDGFRFDGCTSMLYHHHGIDHRFSEHYREYFGEDTDLDAVVYLMLANALIGKIRPAVTIAEDVSGMPTLCSSIEAGGIGFDYRMAMGIPDMWIQTLETKDEDWDLHHIVTSLLNRRRTEKTIAYVECHDQSLVGGKTLSFRLKGQEMWTNMSVLSPMSPNIKRGLSLHKTIRLMTLVLGGDAWLNFMGNEFGHPDWIDFPREGNGWSHDRCRRLWSLMKTSHLRYKSLALWDAAMMQLQKDYDILTASIPTYTIDQSHRVVTTERRGLLFVFNFASKTYKDVAIHVRRGGHYRRILDSDDGVFDGDGTFPLGELKLTTASRQLKSLDALRPYVLHVSCASRTCMVMELQ